MIAPLPFPTVNVSTPPTEAELLQRHVPLVRSVVGRIVATLPPAVEAADLYSVGLMGLMAAVRKYDVAQGNTFEAYAMQRIRGAVLDELRRMDRLPRSARIQSRKVRSATQELSQELGRDPSEVEVGDRLGVDPQAMARLRRRIQPIALLSMDAPRASDDSTTGPDWHESLSDPMSEITAERLEREEAYAILRERVSHLDERARRILEMYYREGLKMNEIARIFRVTEARICQIHAQSLATLRRSLPRALEA